MYIYLMTLNILLMGLWWVPLFHPSVLFVIMFIPFTHPSPNSVPLCIHCFWTLLCFMFLFYFAFSPLVLFSFPKPWPWYMPNSHYPDMFLFDTYMFRTSCMFLSLKLTLIVPRTPCPGCPLPKDHHLLQIFPRSATRRIEAKKHTHTPTNSFKYSQIPI